jgi:hypothetical protein
MLGPIQDSILARVAHVVIYGATIVSAGINRGRSEWAWPRRRVMVLLTKPFLDDILKRAAKDFGDVVYPKLKAGISALAAKALLRTNWKRVTPSGNRS